MFSWVRGLTRRYGSPASSIMWIRLVGEMAFTGMQQLGCRGFG